MSHEGDTPLTPEEKKFLQDLHAQTKALIEALDKTPPALRKIPVVHPPVQTREARVKIDWVEWTANVVAVVAIVFALTAVLYGLLYSLLH
jgi:hypothetical protein